MASQAQRVIHRLKELESNPYTNIAEGSEHAKLLAQLPYANTIDIDTKKPSDA